jgi:hypothetical protein
MAIIQTSCVEGAHELALNGDPATLELALLTKALAVDPLNPGVNELYAGSVFADLTEASWSGSTPYARISVALPTPVDGVWTITTSSVWDTGTATNGPSAVRTLAALIPTTPRKVWGLWDLPYYAGTTVDMSSANATLTIAQPYILFQQTITVTT